jgi:hypothetical protein
MTLTGTELNYGVIVCSAGVALVGLFGKCFNEIRTRSIPWGWPLFWPLSLAAKLLVGITALGWTIVVLSVVAVYCGIGKYHNDEVQLTIARTVGQARELEGRYQESLLSAEQKARDKYWDEVQAGTQKKCGETVAEAKECKSKLDGVSGRLTHLQEASDRMLKEEGKATEDIKNQFVVALNKSRSEDSERAHVDFATLLGGVTDLQDKHVRPIHERINARGTADGEFATLANVKAECMNDTELQSAFAQYCATPADIRAAMLAPKNCMPCTSPVAQSQPTPTGTATATTSANTAVPAATQPGTATQQPGGAVPTTTAASAK